MGLIYEKHEQEPLANFVANPKTSLKRLISNECDKIALIQDNRPRFMLAQHEKLSSYIDQLLKESASGELPSTDESSLDPQKLSAAQKTLLKIRNKFDFFNNLSDQEIISLTTRVTFTKHTKGEYIFMAGSAGQEIYFVINGGVQICIPHESGGKKLIPIAAIQKGQIFGEMAPITKEPRSATTVAMTDDTALLSFQIKGQPDPTTIKSFFTLYCNFVNILSDKLRQMNQMVHGKK